MVDVIRDIELQAKNHPDKIAIKYQHRQLSYHQLDCLSNQLANCLVEHNITGPKVVAVTLPCSIEMVVACLAVLKVGATYLPLDDNDKVKCNQKLVGTQVSIFLYWDRTGKPQIEDTDAEFFIDINTVLSENSGYESCPALVSADEHCASVICFQTDVEDEPLGVNLTRENIQSAIAAIQAENLMQSEDKVLIDSPHVVVTHLLLPLVCGATLVLPDDEQRSNAASLGQLIDSHGVTVVLAQSDTWQNLSHSRWSPAQAITAICCAKSLNEAQKNQLLKLKPAKAVYLYTPVESAGAASIAYLQPNETVLMGKPLANTRIYILDKRLRPVPLGGAGQLYLGGQGIVQGYINHFALSEQKFISSPFEPNVCLFATGIVVRYVKNQGLESLNSSTLAPTPQLTSVSQSMVNAQDTIVMRLGALFQQLLGGELPQLHESFFELGGNSLLAMHLMIAVNNEFDVELTIGDIFNTSTVGALAQVIKQKQGAGAAVIERVNLSRLPASFEMQFMYQSAKDKHPATYNSFLAVALKGRLDEQALENAISAIIKRHEVFRTRLYLQDDVLMQQVEPFNPERALLHKVAINQTLDDCPAARQWIADAVLTPFELLGGQLFRFTLLKLNDAESILAVDFHHIIIDGWSLANFFEQLSEVYNAIVTDQPLEPETPLLHYSDYSHWQKQYFTGSRLKAELGFWQNYLKGDITKLNLPVDRPYVDNLPCEGEGFLLPLNNDLFVRANALSQQLQVTPFMLYFAVFNLMLRQMTGQSDLVVGLPVANRKNKGLDKVMGLFANAIVLRNDLSDNVLFGDFVEQVKLNTLEAFDHDGLPMLLLEQALVEDNPAQHLPIFQILFVFQNNTGKRPSLEGLELNPMPLKPSFSKRDFAFVLSESESGINIFVEFNAYLFDKSTIERMCEDYVSLVGEVLDNPTLPIHNYGQNR